MGRKKKKPEKPDQITAHDKIQIIGSVLTFAGSVLTLIAAIITLIAVNKAN